MPSDDNVFAPLPVDEPAAVPPARWYAVSPLKLVLLSFATFNLYLLYWHYQQWTRIKARGADILPWARALFQLFFVRALFRKIRDAGGETGAGLAADALGGAYVVMLLIDRITSKLPDEYGLISLLSFLIPLILVPVQGEINRQLQEQHPAADLNDRFDLATVVILLIGLPVFLMGLGAILLGL